MSRALLPLHLYAFMPCVKKSSVYITICVTVLTKNNYRRASKLRSASLIKGRRWSSSLRHCATSRKVAGSISDGLIGIFHWHNSFGRTMVLGLTQPLTETSTRDISWGQRRPLCRADNLTTFMCRLSWNLGVSTSWNPQGPVQACMGLLYLLPLIKKCRTLPDISVCYLLSILKCNVMIPRHRQYV